MRLWARTSVAIICAGYLIVAGAQATISNAGPSPYPQAAKDWPGEGVIRVFGWMKQNRESFWKQRERKQGAWVLAGDSLLGNWKTSERDLAPTPTANRAIGGDVSRGLLFRFQEDVLDLHPSGIVVLIGGNDLSAQQKTDQTARNIDRMLQEIRSQSADLPVILCTLPPRDSEKAPIKPSELTNLNASIRELAKKYGNVELLDLYPLFSSADGQPQLQLLAADRLHIGAAGYEVLGRALKAKIESMKAAANG
ncbi:GDSL-type esterase/lipase family protein [Peristeroidobacter soli]|jgi:lysophospholipase L1-like esterase|uniref:GDSL-type esterase/lipase family protein n=1 Tax=Peristeroidobacter soli TaxID=2497877 RepID=UPI00101CF24C|nr:GDSL-type esterase/lipase family protein [Peristeroidobacter soli]